jgi:hypothetical protein
MKDKLGNAAYFATLAQFLLVWFTTFPSVCDFIFCMAE